ncbi:MAG: hypothetical protein M1834_006749 [Cirrosporium novae-zelandiae]|nr:MAG: hypothetical protein M1834_006749 [Cirrosporium novae-zelandiae]
MLKEIIERLISTADHYTLEETANIFMDLTHMEEWNRSHGTPPGADSGSGSVFPNSVVLNQTPDLSMFPQGISQSYEYNRPPFRTRQFPDNESGSSEFAYDSGISMPGSGECSNRSSRNSNPVPFEYIPWDNDPSSNYYSSSSNFTASEYIPLSNAPFSNHDSSSSNPVPFEYIPWDNYPSSNYYSSSSNFTASQYIPLSNAPPSNYDTLSYSITPSSNYGTPRSNPTPPQRKPEPKPNGDGDA